jgi:hypothetical protein
MMNCNAEQNKEKCNCTYEPCERKGMCCECIRYHRLKGELPACLFPADVEKTYDRSIERFIQVYQKRGRQMIQETRS